MSCSCKNKVVNQTRPDEPCLFCAHKHVAAARVLCELEPGYESINRSDAIAQLIPAAWHLQKEHFAQAMQSRDIWKRIEARQEGGPMLAELQAQRWKMTEKTKAVGV